MSMAMTLILGRMMSIACVFEKRTMPSSISFSSFISESSVSSRAFESWLMDMLPFLEIRLLMMEVDFMSSMEIGLSSTASICKGVAMNTATFTRARLAYSFGMISPNRRMMNVTTMTCMTNPSIGLSEKSNRVLMRYADRMTMPTFTKLLDTSMVANRRLGFLCRLYAFSCPLSFSSLSCPGVSEK